MCCVLLCSTEISFHQTVKYNSGRGMSVPTHEDPGSGMPKGSDTAHGPQSSQWPQVGPLLRGKECVGLRCVLSLPPCHPCLPNGNAVLLAPAEWVRHSLTNEAWGPQRQLPSQRPIVLHISIHSVSNSH